MKITDEAMVVVGFRNLLDQIPAFETLVTVDQFCESAQIGKTKFYEFVAVGIIKIVKVGRATRIELFELEAFPERLRRLSNKLTS